MKIISNFPSFSGLLGCVRKNFLHLVHLIYNVTIFCFFFFCSVHFFVLRFFFGRHNLLCSWMYSLWIKVSTIMIIQFCLVFWTTTTTKHFSWDERHLTIISLLAEMVAENSQGYIMLHTDPCSNYNRPFISLLFMSSGKPQKVIIMLYHDASL